MPRWNYSVNIKQFLGGESAEEMQATYDNIVKAIKHVPSILPRTFHHYCKLAVKQEDVNIFNLGLAALYDWADEERVWLGL